MTSPLDHAFDETQIGLLLIDEHGSALRVNHAAAAMVGTTPGDLVGQLLPLLVHPDDLEAVMRELGVLITTGHAGPVQARLLRNDLTWVRVRAHATVLPGPTTMGFVVIEDVTEEHQLLTARDRAQAAATRRAAQQAAVATVGREALAGSGLPQLASLASSLVVAAAGASHCGVLFPDDDPQRMALVGAAGVLSEWAGRYSYPRDAAVEAALASRDVTVRPDLAADVASGSDSDLGRLDRRVFLDAGVRSVVIAPIVPRAAEPGLLTVGAPEPSGFDDDDITFFESIANLLASVLDSRHALDELRFNALHDSLTGLPNRTLVLDRLELALAQAERNEHRVAVLAGDVDRFKVVNDGMGHAAGDEVLRNIAERLRERVRPGDTVGRFGGDEFVVVCPEIDDPAEVIEIAERLQAAVAEPMVIGGTEIVVTTSIGVALGDDVGAAPAAALLRDADAAMYRAKARGRARFELFDDRMRAWAGERLRIEAELRRAIAADELVLHYQPLVSVTDLSVVGAEALVRWQHPTRGLLQPQVFLGVAEEAGLMAELGAWAFDTAARQTAAWIADGSWDGRTTAVNLAPLELADPGLVDRIATSLGEAGVRGRSMCVELTERALVEDAARVDQVLRSFASFGLGVSIDDFGTGYSSLTHLRRLPVRCLKLDGTFVRGLGELDDDVTIARAVISMAEALGLAVVAEGVETELQLATLRDLGCHQAQGFHIAPPMPPDELAAWMKGR